MKAGEKKREREGEDGRGVIWFLSVRRMSWCQANQNTTPIYNWLSGLLDN